MNTILSEGGVYFIYWPPVKKNAEKVWNTDWKFTANFWPGDSCWARLFRTAWGSQITSFGESATFASGYIREAVASAVCRAKSLAFNRTVHIGRGVEVGTTDVITTTTDQSATSAANVCLHHVAICVHRVTRICSIHINIMINLQTFTILNFLKKFYWSFFDFLVDQLQTWGQWKKKFRKLTRKSIHESESNVFMILQSSSCHSHLH